MEIQVTMSPESGFKGFCKVKVPTFKERAEYLKEMSRLKVDGEVDGAALMAFLYDVVKKSVTQVELTDGVDTFFSFDELEYFTEFQHVINEVGLYVVQGVSLGKR